MWLNVQSPDKDSRIKCRLLTVIISHRHPPADFSILILSSLWGTAVSSGLTLSLSLSNKEKMESGRDQDVFAWQDGCVLLTGYLLLVCLVCTNTGHIHAGYGWKDTRPVGGEQGGNRGEREMLVTERGGGLKLNGGLFTEAEPVKEAAHPPAPTLPPLLLQSSRYFRTSRLSLCDCLTPPEHERSS